MNDLKQHIIRFCTGTLIQKVNDLNAIMHEISDATNNETKSSVGDKHETSRAMMQLEQEKSGMQLKEAEEQLKEFERIDFTKLHQKITQGSLVETNKGLFFIATSIGKIEVDKNTVFVISNKSPLALAFLGKSVNDDVTFNGVLYSILNIK